MDCKEHINSSGNYCITITPTAKIHTTLGRIRKKNDGRWEWFRWSCKHGFFPNWNNGVRNSQGAVSSREEAIIKVLEGWPKDIRKNSIFYKGE